VDGSNGELVDLNQLKNGEFFMSYEDFLSFWHKLTFNYKFPREYSGLRFRAEWTAENSGGVPYKGTQEQAEAWKRNSQYRINLNRKDGKKTNLFVSLAQPDGRMKATAEDTFPYANYVQTVILVCCRLGKGQKVCTSMNSSLVKMSSMKQYKEISLNLTLENGDYVIVPSTMEEGVQGQYFLSVYFDCGQNEISITNSETDDKGTVIQEEEETSVKFDDDLKKVLKVKTAKMLYLENNTN
jgi:hypothetical protein